MNVPALQTSGAEGVEFQVVGNDLEFGDIAPFQLAEGGDKVYLPAVRTWVRKLGPTPAPITRYSPDRPLAQARYRGSTPVDADAQTVIDILAMRRGIETLFED